MRKVLLGLALCLVAIVGVGASSGSAFAASCVMSPGVPGPLLHGMYAPSEWQCSDVDIVQFSEYVFEGGGPGQEYDGGQIGTSTMGAHGCYSPIGGASCQFPWTSQFDPCPLNSTGYGPLWWGHQIKFRIHNFPTNSWGAWTSWSVASGGWYGTCYN